MAEAFGRLIGRFLALFGHSEQRAEIFKSWHGAICGKGSSW
jgi:hypothetical protein